MATNPQRRVILCILYRMSDFMCRNSNRGLRSTIKFVCAQSHRLVARIVVVALLRDLDCDCLQAVLVQEVASKLFAGS